MTFSPQAGGELTDYVIVLRNKDAVRIFSGSAHLSVGAGLSAAAGIVGRTAESDLRAGDGGHAACYTYSCSKGMFHANVVLYTLFIRNLLLGICSYKISF